MSGGTDEIEPGDGPRPSVIDAAALWVVRCPDGESDTAALDRWIEEDADHAAAYADTMAVWRDLGSVLPDWKRDMAPLPEPAPVAAPRRRLVFGAVLASLLVVCFLGLQWLNRPLVLETAIGEQRQVTLADGSRVMLNTNSQLTVEHFGAERRVVAGRGELYFDVAHDAAHPFIVEAGGRSVRVLGTSFIVRRDGDRLSVTLLNGSVDISQPQAASVRLKPGDRFVSGQPGQGERVDRPRIDAVTAWRRGELFLDNTPLADAVADMNRYSERPIVLSDPALGRLTLSGVFKTGESDSFTQTVASIFRLKVDAKPGELRLSSAGTEARR